MKTQTMTSILIRAAVPAIVAVAFLASSPPNQAHTPRPAAVGVTIGAGAVLPASASSVMVVRHRMPPPAGRLRVLASRVGALASRVHRSAEASRHHFSWREARALERLHELDAAAEHYRRQVHRSHRYSSHTEDDFQDLLRAYTRASRSFPHLHAYRFIRHDFEELGYWMDQLTDLHTRHGAWGYGSGPQSSYGRGPYGHR